MFLKAGLWEVPEHVWGKIASLLDTQDPQKRVGRKRSDQRRVMDGVIFKFRTGCPWNRIPKVYGSDRTIHRSFQKWVKLGIWERLWMLLVEECPDLDKIDWKRASQDDSQNQQDRHPPG